MISDFEICWNHKGIFLDAPEEDSQMFLWLLAMMMHDLCILIFSMHLQKNFYVPVYQEVYRTYKCFKNRGKANFMLYIIYFKKDLAL